MSEYQKNIIKIAPETLVAIITAMLLLPLLLVGFFVIELGRDRSERSD